MKKHVQLLALISVILFFAGLVFKVMHFPGAGILLMLGSFLGVLFLILFMGSSASLLTNPVSKTTTLLGAITMIVVLLGFLFKVMHWPGAQIMLVLSHLSLLLWVILMFVDAFKEEDDLKKSLKLLFAFSLSIFMTILIFLSNYIKEIAS